jgi:hypothetical protein
MKREEMRKRKKFQKEHEKGIERKKKNSILQLDGSQRDSSVRRFCGAALHCHYVRKCTNKETVSQKGKEQTLLGRRT